MLSISETACTFDGASLEALGSSRHAERFLGLWLELGWAHHPVLILLLLFS